MRVRVVTKRKRDERARTHTAIYYPRARVRACPECVYARNASCVKREKERERDCRSGR